jgi:hypothetical protein
MAKRKVGSQIVSLTSDQKKVGNRPNLLGYRGHATYLGKLSMRATTLLQTASPSKVCLQSYGAPKSWESQLARFRDSHLRAPGEKSHLDVGSMASHRVYYKGGRWWLPQVRAMVSLVCLCCLWLVLTPKVFQLCTNHFACVVCRHVWVSEAC